MPDKTHDAFHHLLISLLNRTKLFKKSKDALPLTHCYFFEAGETSISKSVKRGAPMREIGAVDLRDVDIQLEAK